MSSHKNINRICAMIAVVTVLTAFVFSYFGESLGINASETDLSYTTKLFNTDQVHTIDISISEDDWNDLQENASDEEYQVCDVTIDGDTVNNVAIRPKGNSSLSSVVSSDSQRYSFKIEFDHYNEASTYYGLDKLNLNNIISDNTYMKEYLVYNMMQSMGVVSPLCSFSAIYVNGQYFGLYLAVEGVEDAFASRNYGSESGNIYKPETQDMGDMADEMGDMGNMGGMNDMGGLMELMNILTQDQIQTIMTQIQSGQDLDLSQILDADQLTQFNAILEENGISDLTELFPSNQMQNNMPGQNNATNDGEQGALSDQSAAPDTDQSSGEVPDMQQQGMGGGGMGGESSNGAGLEYIDDDASSYSAIFDNAVTDTSSADEDRLISALEQMNNGENLAQVLNTEQILKYLVVHTFVDNFDSYTGSMLHNYYLREDDGQLSIIPWDYNLAFGSFMNGGGMGTDSSDTSVDEATSLVNFPIDTPVSGDMADRPLVNILLSNETYLELYHQYYLEFIDSYFTSGTYLETIEEAQSLISSYVETDPTAFCSYEEFQAAVAVLEEFCTLRAESVSGQLDGSIPATSDGQEANPDALIDASSLDIDALGNSTGMGGGMQDMNQMPQNINSNTTGATASEDTSPSTASTSQTGDTSSLTDANNQAQAVPGNDQANLNGMPNKRAANDGFNSSNTLDLTAVYLLIVSIVLLAGGFLFLRLYRK
ncbi:CotH kinase family protein [Eubacteriaceae bacterium ES2]|nr:CotH kinase family protein [Eubacteriaceae bacterium ES2]